MKLRARTGEVHAIPTIVPEAELRHTYRDALAMLVERRGREGLGDFLEFGVYIGTSMACMYDALAEQGIDHVRLFGFDSFEGLPADAASDNTAIWKSADFTAPLAAAEANLTAKGVEWDRVELVKGWFDDTLSEEFAARHDIRKASVIMVDCDLYSSAKAALDFAAPLIRDDAVVLFDDWWPDTLGAQNLGEKRAFEEFLAEHSDLSATELDSYAPESAKVFLVSRRPSDEPGHLLESARTGHG